jgi:hypothetical protein
MRPENGRLSATPRRKQMRRAGKIHAFGGKVKHFGDNAWGCAVCN